MKNKYLNKFEKRIIFVTGGSRGIGKEIVNALNSLDMPVVMGAVMLIASVFVLINIVVDIVYAIIDPRIRLS